MAAPSRSDGPTTSTNPPFDHNLSSGSDPIGPKFKASENRTTFKASET